MIKSNKSMLVVLDRPSVTRLVATEQPLSDDELHEMIYRLLDAGVPKSGMRTARAAGFPYVMAYEAVKKRYVTFFDEKNRQTRSHLVADNLELLTHLLRQATAKGLTHELIHPTNLERDMLARENRDVEVLVSDDPKLQGISCSEPAFETRVVYHRHPADLRHYLRLASFHDVLVEDKMAELGEVCTSLGAKSVRLSQREGGEAYGRGRVGVDGVKAADVKVEAELKRSMSETRSLRIEAREPAHAPELPHDLRWYHLEPSWQKMARARLRSFITTYKFEFEYKKDFGVDVELCTRLKGVGLSIGGGFQSMRQVRQTYEAEFFSLEDYRAAGIEVAKGRAQ